MLKWQFWVDRGGTFTDLVARTPQGDSQTLKLLSESPEHYDDAVLEGIHRLMQVPSTEPIPCWQIESIRIGTTVATNALLERKGVPTLLLTTQGFADALKIGYQNRPDLFALDIQLPDLLYSEVLEIDERLAGDGSVVRPLSAGRYLEALQAAYQRGIRSVAVVCMHAYKNPCHELAIGEIAQQAGFTQISLSHQISPLVKFVGRGDTTVVDAYLSPILSRYVQRLSKALPNTRLLFMQSCGGLSSAENFRGCNSLLSGPAGGVVGGVKTAEQVGCQKVLGFDMGGTSTDVWHYKGEYQRVYETHLAGVRLRVPMMDIHTVAAGGGSLCYFDGSRFRVGPESAGADPGPACYRRGGPLTITDCNLILGRLSSAHFPAVFGPKGDESLNLAAAVQKLDVEITKMPLVYGEKRSRASAAAGFIEIAVESMAGAIKTISTQRGYDIAPYALACFGGAGAQHACAVATALGVEKILIHPAAGVLSALGMGLAEISAIVDRTLGWPLDDFKTAALQDIFSELRLAAIARLPDASLVTSIESKAQKADYTVTEKVYLRYEGADTTLIVKRDTTARMQLEFESAHQARFSFLQNGKALFIDRVSIELSLTEPQQVVNGGASEMPAITRSDSNAVEEKRLPIDKRSPLKDVQIDLYSEGEYRPTPIVSRNTLTEQSNLAGPLMLVDDTSTSIIDPGWCGKVLPNGMLVLTKTSSGETCHKVSIERDPIKVEIFNYRFMAIAEQMGAVLANTAHSVNIKERFDFSCALFDSQANLIANAPHVPVHLGSMSETVRVLIEKRGDQLKPGDAYLLNSPYAGGTHLPDLTVVSPVFHHGEVSPVFYVATRAHHADIGGMTPGSMPAQSRHIEEEGVLIEDFLLVESGAFRLAEVHEILSKGTYPVRNIQQNIADLQAQVAANTYGVNQLKKLVKAHGEDVVSAYMQYVQDNAEEAVQRVIADLHGGSFALVMDSGATVKVDVRVNRSDKRLCLDFSGSSAELAGNFNAPAAVCRAAVLYVIRTLVTEPIPLNSGCLRPVDIIIPEGSMLSPRYPAAVVAGNVETSQIIADALYGALGVLAGSQGTMNNLTFGNERYQYYETICGGAGAGESFSGASAVQVHMTNSRLTDPEILELRFPVRLELFSLRQGSGGAGRYSGGEGVKRSLRFLEPMTVTLLSNSRKVPPFGLQGGAAGQCGMNSVVRKNGQGEVLPSVAHVELHTDDVLTIETPGGGGYGQQ